MTDAGPDRYREVADRIMARAMAARGTMADQLAGDAAAELGLQRTAALTDRLGRPQDGLMVVHVAGTKGKGSTVAFISAILVAGGHRVGRATSPHLIRLTERIAVDERDIDDEAFVRVADRVLRVAGELERDRPELGQVNALEILFAMALVAFRDAGCRVAVVEVGIGGRLDTTNIIDPAVSVITTLDLEHTAILGDTLAAIASEKAGIIKPGRPVVVAPQAEEALEVILAAARVAGSRLIVVDPVTMNLLSAPIGLRGDHQVVNASLAVAALQELAELDAGLTVDPDAIRAGLRQAWLPGRFEIVPDDAINAVAGRDRWPGGGRPVMVLDGAHTPLAAAAVRALMASEFPPSNRTVAVCGFSSDKDVRAFLVALDPSAILPVAASSPRALPVDGIARDATDLGITLLSGPAGVGDAVRHLLRSEAALDRILVTGSFAVVAEARTALGLS